MSYIIYNIYKNIFTNLKKKPQIIKSLLFILQFKQKKNLLNFITHINKIGNQILNTIDESFKISNIKKKNVRDWNILSIVQKLSENLIKHTYIR